MMGDDHAHSLLTTKERFLPPPTHPPTRRQSSAAAAFWLWNLFGFLLGSMFFISRSFQVLFFPQYCTSSLEIFTDFVFCVPSSISPQVRRRHLLLLLLLRDLNFTLTRVVLSFFLTLYLSSVSPQSFFCF